MNSEINCGNLLDRSPLVNGKGAKLSKVFPGQVRAVHLAEVSDEYGL